jgi:hypothetical protein
LSKGIGGNAVESLKRLIRPPKHEHHLPDYVELSLGSKELQKTVGMTSNGWILAKMNHFLLESLYVCKAMEMVSPEIGLLRSTLW